MKKLILLSIIPVIASCSNTSFGPKPPEISPPSEIQTYYTEQEKDALKDLTPAQYVAAGYNKVYAACTTYFDALIKVQNETEFAKDTTVAAGSATGAILGLANAASAVIAGLAAGVGFASATIENFNKHALVTPYPDETKSLILAALDKFSTDAPPETTTSPGLAIARVQHYAELCTYSGISRFAKQALQSAKLASDNQQTSILSDSDRVYAAAIAGKLGTAQQFTQDQLALLYWFFVDKGDGDKTTSLSIMKNFPDSIKALLIDSKGTPTSGEPAIASAVKPWLVAVYQGNKQFQKLVADKKAAGTGSQALNPGDGGSTVGASQIPHIYVVQ